MTESMAGLRREIESCTDLQSVVRTMKALAAASIGQYERSVLALGDYYRTAELGLHVCLEQLDPDALRTGAPAPGRAPRVGAVIFGSDQGLVGQFNDVVVDAAVEALASEPGRPRVWVVGERARVCLAEAGYTAEESFPAPNSIEAVAPLVRRLLVQSEGLHAEGALTELHLHHNRPTSGSGYAPVAQRLLPLDTVWSRRLLDAQWPTNKLAQVLGDREATLRSLVHEFLFISLFRACTESLASENASRLAAMERADRNIAELLERLEESLHRRRQAGIDEELFDVISGFQALADRRAEPPLPSTRASACLDPRPRPCSPTRARHDR